MPVPMAVPPKLEVQNLSELKLWEKKHQNKLGMAPSQ